MTCSKDVRIVYFDKILSVDTLNTVKPVLSGHSKIDKIKVSLINADQKYCRMLPQNAPFCKTFGMYLAIIGLENLFAVFFEWSQKTCRFYCVCLVYAQTDHSRERSGSVVECLTRDRWAAGSSLTGVTALWSLSKTHLS